MTIQLILLPGLEGTGVMFRPLIAAFGTGIRPVPVSYPGDRALSYPELLELVLAALPRHEPFVLLGESFSGPLAILAASSAPPGLRALVLCASFVRNPHPYIPKALTPLLGPAPFRFFPFAAQAKALLGSYSSPELRSLLREAHSRVAPEVFAHRLRSVATVDVRHTLRGLTLPVLYIRATRDFVVPFWNAREVKALLPSAILIDIKGPHLLLQTQPVLAAAAIARFVRGNAAQRSGCSPHQIP